MGLLRRRRHFLLFCLLGLVAATLSHPGSVPATAAVAGCGTPVAKPTGGYWQCTFADNFDGTSLNRSKWSAVLTRTSGFRSGGACFVDQPGTISVGSGALRLTVRRGFPMVCTSKFGTFLTSYRGGYVSTHDSFAQAYGRYAFRAKFPATTGPGIHSAIWLWPSDPNRYGSKWPASGEIDIAEFFSTYRDRVIPYVHYVGDRFDPARTNTKCMVSRPQDFHTYVLEWTPTTMAIRYDGRLCLVNKWAPTNGLVRPAPFNRPFHVNLTQALGIFPNRYAGDTALPATMVVDYVRVWR